LDIGQSPFPRGKLGVSLGTVSSKTPEQGYRSSGDLAQGFG
jgi:hypothetical protein